MSKVAHYLQQHLSGEVQTATDVRRYFSTDGSIFALTPSLVVFPRNENDIRKTARFSWQLAERGRVIPITPRGAGTDQGGAAIGNGILMVSPAHLNRILEFDGKTGTVTVEPGINYGKLQQTLQTHGRFLPAAPISLEYTTVGGAVANNTGGPSSLKYGSIKGYVKGLRVVLANGEVIETRRISKRELHKKLGLTTFEGEVYRSLDTLIEENQQLIKDYSSAVTKNSAGYDIFSVKKKDGSFDLTPLFVGSQGTLGIISEVVLQTSVHTPESTLIAAFIDDLQVADEILKDIRKQAEQPSAIEFIDQQLLSFVNQQNPNQLKSVVENAAHKMVLLIEYDNANARLQKKLAKKTTKILQHYQVPFKSETEEEKKEELWKIRDAAASVLLHGEGGLRPLPIIEDAIVPPERFSDLLGGLYQLFDKHSIKSSVWGDAGDANIHTRPFLDLGQVGDRQKAFRLAEEYYNLVFSLGGSTSGENGDGRVRAPYLKQQYGEELYGVFQKVKQIFDPYSMLNPGVKINVTLEDIKPLLRNEYSQDFIEHLPRG